jgi:hypothetical protein
MHHLILFAGHIPTDMVRPAEDTITIPGAVMRAVITTAVIIAHAGEYE